MTAATRPDSAATTTDNADQPSKVQARIGLVLSVLPVLFLLFDAVMKLIKPVEVVTATVALGFPESTIRTMGVLLLIGVVLYVFRRTAIFGAVFTTAYLGGAVCANVRVESPLLGYTLFPVYVAILLWLGLYLRSAALRRLVRTGC